MEIYWTSLTPFDGDDHAKVEASQGLIQSHPGRVLGMTANKIATDIRFPANLRERLGSGTAV